MNRSISILFLFVSSFVFAQDSAVIKNVNYYTSKAEHYLALDKTISEYFSISDKGIAIYSSANNKASNKPEFHIDWKNVEQFKICIKSLEQKKIFEIYKSGTYDIKTEFPVKKIGSQPAEKQRLKGYKIAIDPGHIAGNMETGELEKKYLKFKCDSANGKPQSISIAEGTLTFATAELLKEKLKAEGAEVLMTRKYNGATAFGITYDQWLRKGYKSAVDSLFKIGEITQTQKDFFYNIKTSKEDIFRALFKDLELKKRAEIINEFKPDLTIIIHYNVDESNTGWKKPGTKNFNMAFVGGAFVKNDLVSPEKRFEFLRLLISDDLEKSIALSSAMIKSFEKNLNVPTAKAKDAQYLYQNCLSAGEKGVYCRNLQLTRQIHSPLVYGETLYQDNVNECELLNKESDKTKNERVKQVAEAYFQGILDYSKNTKQ